MNSDDDVRQETTTTYGMPDKLAVAVSLIVAGITLYITFTAAAQFDDPEYMCRSTLGEEWHPAANVTPPENGWVCEAPNGSIERVKFVNVTNNARFDYIGVIDNYD